MGCIMMEVTPLTYPSRFLLDRLNVTPEQPYWDGIDAIDPGPVPIARLDSQKEPVLLHNLENALEDFAAAMVWSCKSFRYDIFCLYLRMPTVGHINRKVEARSADLPMSRTVGQLQVKLSP